MSTFFRRPLLLLSLVAACEAHHPLADLGGAPDGGADPAAPDPGAATRDWGWMAPDVRRALEALPAVEVAAPGLQGFPAFIRGELARVPRSAVALTELDLRPALDAIAQVFRLQGGDFKLARLQVDDLGMTHARYQQVKHGFEVVGGDLKLHVTADGLVYAANGTAHGALDDMPPNPTVTPEQARAAALGLPGATRLDAETPVLGYAIVNATGSLHLVWQVTVKGRSATGEPILSIVSVDALGGARVDNRSRVYSARFRSISTADFQEVLPGTLTFDDNVPNPGEYSDVYPEFPNWELLGSVYDLYWNVFKRDSYDGFAARLDSTVNYTYTDDNGNLQVNNAFWFPSEKRLVFCPGDSVEYSNFAVSPDVMFHEFTHAVTESESALAYGNESGALNEAISDIFSAIGDQWRRNTIDHDTWLLAEDIKTPGTDGDALRYMDYPTQNGYQRDHYADLMFPGPCIPDGGNDYCGVHANSGIANLAFYLMVVGETRNGVTVPSIGMQKARDIIYRTNTLYLTSEATFAVMRAATVQAARDLFGTTTANSVGLAWSAVGVWTGPSNDDFANATSLPAALPIARGGSTFFATWEAGEPGMMGSVWYKWVPQTTGMVRIEPAGQAFAPQRMLYLGSSVSALSEWAGGWSGRVGVIAGSTYRLQVSSPVGEADDFSLYLDPVPESVRYLSDLAWTSATNGFGPVEKDRSVNGSAANDGKVITLAGVPYSKGLGAHAPSDIRYSLGGAFSRFVASVGVDDEVNAAGKVVFQVYGDSTKLFDSGAMTGNSATKNVNVDVSGRMELRLVVTDGGDGKTSDHADWADARLVPSSVTDVSPPKRPSNLHQTAKSARGVTLEWTFSEEESGEYSYQLFNGNTPIAAPCCEWAEVRGLTPSTSYVFTVRAIDGSGNISGPSNAFAVTTDAEAGTGLRGRYYTGRQFTVDTTNRPMVNRVDGTVNFSWTGSPATGVPSDNFSVRWTGEVIPAYSETYTFYTSTSDGARLWVDGRLVIDKWIDQNTKEWSGTIALQANRRYEIRMEMYEATGAAAAKLSWSSPSRAKEVIPKAKLYPSP